MTFANPPPGVGGSFGIRSRTLIRVKRRPSDGRKYPGTLIIMWDASHSQISCHPWPGHEECGLRVFPDVTRRHPSTLTSLAIQTQAVHSGAGRCVQWPALMAQGLSLQLDARLFCENKSVPFAFEWYGSPRRAHSRP